MSRTATLTVLISDVRTKADIGGATVRHTDAQITRLINQSIQSFRERISDEGSNRYLVSSTGTLTVGVTSPYPFLQLDLSALSPSLVRTFGIDVTFPGGRVVSLDYVPFNERARYGSTTELGSPVAWTHFRTDQVCILPGPDAAYTYTVWYLPKFTDLSAGSDTFDGVAGWEDWVVWDVVSQVIARDQFPQAFAIAEARRADAEAKVMRGATKVTQAGGAHVGQDSFGRKLTHFLGGRRQAQVAAGGQVTPASGSVTNAMLADMTGPTVKGVMSGTTRPGDVGVATLTTFLSLFSTTQRGLVPPPLGLGSLFLRDDGTWAAAGGGGGGASVGPSGAVQFQAGTGFAGASGLRIIGNSPSLLLRLDGSMRVTGGQVEVGSGTVRVSASGVDLGNGSIVNVATLATAALDAPEVTSSFKGLAPASGGGTSNFLRADGTWATPPTGGGGSGNPAGDTGNIQYRDEVGGFAAATTLSMRGSGSVLWFGIPTGTVAPSATAQAYGRFLFYGGNRFLPGAPSSVARFDQILDYSPSGVSGQAAITVGGGSGLINTQRFRTNASGTIQFQMGASGTRQVTFLAETGGIDFNGFNVAAKSLQVTDGIPNTELSSMASGTVKGQLGPAGTPNDVSIATLHAFAPSFTASQPGVVPPSGGGTSNFLRADGSWSAPPAGGSSSFAGGSGGIQYAGNQAVSASTNWSFQGSGARLLSGTPTGTPTGSVTFAGADMAVEGAFAIQGRNQAGAEQSIYQYIPSGLAAGGQPTGGVLTYGRASGSIQLHRFQTAPSGSIEFELGPSGPGSLRFMQTGVDFSGRNLRVKSLNVTDTIPNSELASMASGTVKAQMGPAGTPNDVSVNTLLAFAPTFTSARQGMVPPSGGGTTNYLRADGSWAAPSGAAQYPPAGGVTNVEMAVMPTGTVKGNLSGNATPSDVSIATLFAFVPTFTSTQRGVVPLSGGGTTNFLRADGTWAAPPGGSATPGGADTNLQYNNAGAFGGASGLNVPAPFALGLGVPSFLPGFGDIRVASGFNITANLPSGIGGVAARQQILDWTGGGASGVLEIGGASGVMGTVRGEVATGGSFEFLIGGQTGVAIRASGIDARAQHLSVKSMNVGHINGLPFDFSGLKRGLDIGNSSGLPSGLSLYLPRGAGSGANRYIIPSGVSGTGTQAAPRFVTLSPTGGRGGGVIRIERVSDGGWPFEVRTPTGTVLHSFPSGAKGWADCMFEKPSGAVFQLAGHGDMF